METSIYFPMINRLTTSFSHDFHHDIPIDSTKKILDDPATGTAAVPRKGVVFSAAESVKADRQALIEESIRAARSALGHWGRYQRSIDFFRENLQDDFSGKTMNN